jgi:hypothetical protein
LHFFEINDLFKSDEVRAVYLQTLDLQVVQFRQSPFIANEMLLLTSDNQFYSFSLDDRKIKLVDEISLARQQEVL